MTPLIIKKKAINNRIVSKFRGIPISIIPSTKKLNFPKDSGSMLEESLTNCNNGRNMVKPKPSNTPIIKLKARTTKVR